MKRPARRTIFKAVILLIAGATLNVSVAWGLVIADQENLPTTQIANFIHDDWVWTAKVRLARGRCEVQWGGNQMPADSPPGHAEMVRQYRDFTYVDSNIEPINEAELPTWTNRWFDTRERSDGVASNTNRASGWPFFALGYQVKRERLDEPKGGRRGMPASVKGAIIVGAGTWDGTEQNLLGLPYGPLWPGFAINTLFYAGVLWMLCCGPFALRRMIRRRRGRCAQCAYPIGQSPVCTECGAAVTPTVVQG